ncbi:hypothetical protein PFICI_11988 [Pestalotiopsis fici W106-1]|uniref:Uncharacterized protein n=1 Tax=Pestalotiopsis fici (strain W106-1 / CGMCC3.15140) TaxID=1229662 RepID=W3WUR1_PESFW|nr:uncharacterized protein PFICI_11988 [Pestalotiopsis fici W106-1]ETS76601.1 hypothetical protein PFICI_11988 [Pestalotiopsis fici W106-1]
MSSDDMGKSGLITDYTMHFGKLLKRATALILSDRLSIECQNDMEAVVIKARGYVLGYVEAVDDDMRTNNRQCIDVSWRDIFGTETFRGHDIVSWTIQTSSIPLKRGDIVCLIEGATRPTIIRAYRDFSAVLVIAAQPPKYLDEHDVHLTWGSVSKQIAVPQRDFLLVWDWNYSPEMFTIHDCYSAWAHSNEWSEEITNTDTDVHLARANQVLKCGILSLDAGNLAIAEQRCSEALLYYESALQVRDSVGRCQKEFAELLCKVQDRIDAIFYTPLSHDPESQRAVGVRSISLLFFWVLQSEYRFVMKLLSETGMVDPNIGVHGWPSMLSLAIRMGRLDIIDWLLRKGANVNSLSFQHSKEMIPLHEATEMGHLAMVERLLKAKANVNATTRFRKETALQKAAGAGHVAIVDCLLRAKAHVNATNGPGSTALHKASEAGHLAIVERLLQAKADVNVGGRFGEHRPLEAASGAGHLAIVERLIKANAKINGGGYFREKSPIQAASGNGHLAIVERLLQAGADVNIGKEFGLETALVAASHGGHLAVVERLLQAKAHVNGGTGPQRSGRTALQAASEAGHLDIIERLLQAKAWVRETSIDEETALSLASKAGHLHIVERLKLAAVSR